MAEGRFISYLRCSTRRQNQSGLGLDAQREAVANFLSGGAWELLAEYKDVESGKKDDRPELLKAIAHAKRTGATLLIAKLDRLSRDLALTANLMKSGVRFVACDCPEANDFTIHILGAVAEQERKNISSRVRVALRVAKEQRGVKLGNPNLTQADRKKGGKIGGSRTGKARRIAAMGEYVTVTPTILKLRQKGLSYEEIAAYLNDQGEATRQGQGFKAMTVKRILDMATS